MEQAATGKTKTNLIVLIAEKGVLFRIKQIKTLCVNTPPLIRVIHFRILLRAENTYSHILNMIIPVVMETTGTRYVQDVT